MHPEGLHHRVGYRPYGALASTLRKVAPGLEPVQQASDAEEYRKFWGGATNKEVEEALKPLFQKQAQ